MYVRYWRTALINNSAGYGRAGLPPHSGAEQKNGRNDLAQLRHRKPPEARQKILLPELIDSIDFRARQAESKFLREIRNLNGTIGSDGIERWGGWRQRFHILRETPPVM